MDEGVKINLLVVWMALFVVFAGRKFFQPIKVESVIFLELHAATSFCFIGSVMIYLSAVYAGWYRRQICVHVQQFDRRREKGPYQWTGAAEEQVWILDFGLFGRKPFPTNVCCSSSYLEEDFLSLSSVLSSNLYVNWTYEYINVNIKPAKRKRNGTITL